MDNSPARDTPSPEQETLHKLLTQDTSLFSYAVFESLVRPIGGFRLRASSATWFALIGYVDHTGIDPDYVQFGTGLDMWLPSAEGELVVFLNDVHGHYENNHGCVRLSVTRIR